MHHDERKKFELQGWANVGLRVQEGEDVEGIVGSRLLLERGVHTSIADCCIQTK